MEDTECTEPLPSPVKVHGKTESKSLRHLPWIEADRIQNGLPSVPPTERISIFDPNPAASAPEIKTAISEWEYLGLSRKAKTYIHIEPSLCDTDTDIQFRAQWRRYEDLCRNFASPVLEDFFIHGTSDRYEFDLIKCWVYFKGWKLSHEWVHFKRNGGDQPSPIFPAGYEPHFPPEDKAANDFYFFEDISEPVPEPD
ncbi:MAG: hypothetical protein Q9222_001950 [Ikaeria aurantiellina]